MAFLLVSEEQEHVLPGVEALRRFIAQVLLAPTC